jgi:hypothetical protein
MLVRVRQWTPRHFFRLLLEDTWPITSAFTQACCRFFNSNRRVRLSGISYVEAAEFLTAPARHVTLLILDKVETMSCRRNSNPAMTKSVYGPAVKRHKNSDGPEDREMRQCYTAGAGAKRLVFPKSLLTFIIWISLSTAWAASSAHDCV